MYVDLLLSEHLSNMHFNLHEVLHFIKTFAPGHCKIKKLPHFEHEIQISVPSNLPPNYSHFQKICLNFFIAPTRGYSVAFQWLALKADIKKPFRLIH